MSIPPLNNPNARYWDDLVGNSGSFGKSRAVRWGADRMIAEAWARRRSEVRKLKIIADFGDETYVLR